MSWPEIRKSHPDQWLIIEALEAHTTDDHQQALDRMAVIETCIDGSAALCSYRNLHKEYPRREFYYVHTSREELDIHERRWHGVWRR